MAKKSFMSTVGYGPFLVPPLLIVMVVSLSFVYMQPRMNPSSNSTDSKTISEQTSNENKPPTMLPMSDLSTLPTIEPQVISSNQADNGVTNSTSPQPSGSQTQTSLQSGNSSGQLQSRSYGTSGAIKQLLNSTPSLKVDNTNNGQLDTNR